VPPEPDKPSLSDIDKAPETLPAVVPEEVPGELIIDFQARFSEVTNLNFDLQIENAALRSRLETKAAIDSLLGPYSNKVFAFLCCYGLAAFILLLLSGFQVAGFTLDPAVMSFVVGSTAVSAIGLVGLVIKGIFGVAKVS
jgi:hypothetical protein